VGVRDACDATVPKPDEMLDGRPRRGGVVDVDEGQVAFWELAPQDDRHAVAVERDELMVVRAGAGEDEAIDLALAHQADVGQGASAIERFDEQPQPGRTADGRDAFDDGREECVRAEAAGRLAHDQADDAGAVASGESGPRR
jgi:hypothetical protein